MKVLLLSAYDAASHRHWRQTLVAQFPEWDWQVLTLPARYFAWRIRGNSLSWAFGQRELLEQPYDLVIATSMTDLSALRGMVPVLAQIPTLVYFHENQFAYPESGREYGSVEPKVLNIYTALAADYVLFNSGYNRNSFLAGAQVLLKKMPDQVPAGLIERLQARSSVLPVPLNIEQSHPSRIWPDDTLGAATDRPLRILWAARWEFDKGPDRLRLILNALEQRGLNYRLALLGERFRHSPKEFEQIGQAFSHRLDQFGFAESRTEYLSWLRGADLVLSTATHEFQGLAVLEAVAQGCVPVLPARQVYPELFAPEYLYPSMGDADTASEAEQAADLITAWDVKRRTEGLTAPDVSRFSWKVQREAYLKVVTEVASR